MATHVSTLQNIAYKLKILNREIDDVMVMSKILATLPDNYKHFASAWDSTHTAEKTLSNLTARLLGEENRINVKQETEEPVAFRTDEKKQNRRDTSGKLKGKTNNTQDKQNLRCFKCNEPGHFARSCKAASGKEYTTRCSICKKTNYTKRDLFQEKQSKVTRRREE